MLARKFDDGYLLHIEAGEDINEKIEQFAKENGIKSGFFFGIGSIASPTLGYFDVAEKRYRKREFPGDYEIATLSGNISVKFETGELVIHTHIVIGDADYNARCGHLFSGKVSATAEIFLFPRKGEFIRKLDDRTGLFLLA